MKFVVDTTMLMGLVALSAPDVAARPSMEVLAKFSPNFRCPYANEWVAKGPEQAAIDLGLVNFTTHNAQGSSVRRAQEGTPPPGVGGPPDGVGGPPGGEGGGNPFAFAAPSEPVACTIAPGAIGAGHQSGFSTGYSPNCEGTPAEGSPYMWPMAWTAHTESKSMAFGSDDVVYHSKGNVYYRLDKNWKRQDWYYQRGAQRSVGQGPCAPEDDVSEEGSFISACQRDSDEYKTMIHRGGKMMFIDWVNGTETGTNDINNIESCTWLDLAVVGNIRNDWYMDNRGDSTGVQYLGNQHVFHQGVPRLVKQWRKKDFANQYFTMSILENVQRDGIHWPMILNVPGEGFGDDFLQEYTQQAVLTDDDDYLFLLDEALEAAGRTCEKMTRGDGGGGPPSGQTVHIPSNLEVDPNAWFENVYTYSPVWEPPVEEEQSMTTGATGMAVTQEGDITAKSCYDPEAQAVQISLEYSNIEMVGGDLPWMALGFRETEECLMNPRDGGDTELILLTADSPDGEVGAHFTFLPKMARSFDGDSLSSIYSNMVPLEEKDGFSDVGLHLPSDVSTITKSAHDGAEDSVVLHFKQSKPEAPEAMHLMYAVGSAPEIGYHRTRKCFDISAFPTCPAASSASEGQDAYDGTVAAMEGSSACSVTLLAAGLSTLLATLFL